jgi:hypothetical protein
MLEEIEVPATSPFASCNATGHRSPGNISSPPVQDLSRHANRVQTNLFPCEIALKFLSLALLDGPSGTMPKKEVNMPRYHVRITGQDYDAMANLVCKYKITINSSKPKIYSYTIEWGSPDNSTPFHPPYSEMRNIIQEITAALLEFCWRAGA